MKFVFIGFLMIGTAHASQIVIDGWDQIKLGHLMAKLPDNVVDRNLDSLSGGKRVTTVFPRKSDAFSIECVNDYFDDSPVPSTTVCTINIDINHQKIEKNYDEIRTTTSSGAASMFEAFPYGNDSRSFRSGKFDEGIDFNGRKTNIFHYMITCSANECLYRFSEKVLK